MEAEKKEQEHEEDTRTAVENAVKMAAVQAEKKSALKGRYGWILCSTDSKYSYDINSGEFFLQLKFIPDYYQLMSSYILLT